jgi:hypothetical protein
MLSIVACNSLWSLLLLADVLPAHDVAATPTTRQLHQGRTPMLQTPATPQECATMVQAVEEAIQHAQEATPGVLLLQEQLHVQCLLYDDSKLDHPESAPQIC